MPTPIPSKADESFDDGATHLHRLYPGLTAKELRKADTNLSRYVHLVHRILERANQSSAEADGLINSRSTLSSTSHEQGR